MGVNTVITSHVLDTMHGKPGVGIRIELYRCGDKNDQFLGDAVTDELGRVKGFALVENLASGRYMLRFSVAEYFSRFEVATIYPKVDVCFEAEFPGHYHIPLVVSPFGYSTYRGS
jgi:5-hydroxyisourate hydrolase